MLNSMQLIIYLNLLSVNMPLLISEYTGRLISFSELDVVDINSFLGSFVPISEKDPIDDQFY